MVLIFFSFIKSKLKTQEDYLPLWNVKQATAGIVPSCSWKETAGLNTIPKGKCYEHQGQGIVMYNPPWKHHTLRLLVRLVSPDSLSEKLMSIHQKKKKQNKNKTKKKQNFSEKLDIHV